MTDQVFATRLGQRPRTWQVDREPFLAQVQDVVLLATLATADSQDGVPQEWWARAAHVLQTRDDLDLFAAMPPVPSGIAQRVTRLRLMAINLTAGSGHRWVRLVSTAREVLAPDALLKATEAQAEKEGLWPGRARSAHGPPGPGGPCPSLSGAVRR
ncbi:hypothetical protein [Streptomyces sp. t39]|uniref:hypothetical protein n=1 Tax=Streptomyces sp. t39 TaxID=1828156 RepID=UPI0011CD88FA|nr:hypothetical protein [Streptomyces sp. t39]